MGTGPVFIGGVERSGKTYMRMAISAHPKMIIQQRTGMWPYFYKRYGDLGRPENFDRCLAAMLRSKHIRMLQPDPDRIRQEFWQAEPSYARLFALFQMHNAERLGKSRWGDQTLLLERFADPIFTAYPSARMIHMIRDPRDRYEAILARRQDMRGKPGKSASKWLYSVRLAERNWQRYPDQYKIVRYEALVGQPEATLNEVCSFLGEEFVPSMLTLENVPRFKDMDSRDSRQSPLSIKYIGRFRKGISKREIGFIQAYTGRKMRIFGYELEPVHLSPGDWFALHVIDWPLNLAHILAWRSLDGLHQNVRMRNSHKPVARLVT